MHTMATRFWQIQRKCEAGALCCSQLESERRQTKDPGHTEVVELPSILVRMYTYKSLNPGLCKGLDIDGDPNL